VKNKYYIKNNAAVGVGFTIVGVWSVCVYIFYTARGDQVKCNSLFGKREGWGVWSSCGRIYLSLPSIPLILSSVHSIIEDIIVVHHSAVPHVA